MTDAADTFAPNDIVIWRVGGSWDMTEQWGRVTRVTPKGTVFAVPFGHPDAVKEFRGGRGVRKPTAHELAYRMWRKQRPRGEFANAHTAWRSDVVDGVAVDGKIDTPQKARQVAAELLALAEWWDREPEEAA